MLSRPDILVGTPESSEVFLVVEIKGEASLASAEALKMYMVRNSCPAGILVTPESVIFLQNKFTDYQPTSVEEIGHCSTADLLGRKLGKLSTESELAESIEVWLGSLPLVTRRSWPPDAKDAIETVVFPAVVGGVLRTAGPRLRRAS